jgi:tetratricopeptide (TPR) repeat protein
MQNRLNSFRRALRFHVLEEHRSAILELNAILDQDQEWWLGYCVRGRIYAALKSYPNAIADYTRVLSQPNNLNQRNKTCLLYSILVYSNMLSREQKGDLSIVFRKQLGLPYNNPRLGLLWDEWRWIGETSPYLTAEENSVPNKGSVPQTRENKAPVGRIANIGKFLLDQEDLAKLKRLISSGGMYSPTRVFTTYRSID